jgi:hypothetical protein
LVPLKVNLRERLLEKLLGDIWYLKLNSTSQSGRQVDQNHEGYILEEDGLLRYHGRMYIHEGGDIRRIILKEAYRKIYCAHKGMKKMYTDMKNIFFWVFMKHDVVHFVAKCLEFQQVKANHHHPSGLL